MLCVLFFKQKTAYELRISDWSSDVCSSDLQARVRRDVLQRLEDRWADMLAYPLVDQGVPVLVARVPRAAIDLNRHEREIDAAMVGGIPRDAIGRASCRERVCPSV